MLCVLMRVQPWPERDSVGRWRRRIRCRVDGMLHKRRQGGRSLGRRS